MKQLLLAAATILPLLAGCDSAKSGAESQATIAVAVPSASALASLPKPPWFVGKWSGKFKTEAYRIDMTPAQGAVAEWSKDAGKTGVGEVTLELEMTADGDVSGTGDGALGKMVADGHVSGDDVRVRLSTPTAEAASAFSGVLLAAHSGGTLKGKLQVSTGDSLLVRRAEVSLARSTSPAPNPNP